LFLCPHPSSFEELACNSVQHAFTQADMTSKAVCFPASPEVVAAQFSDNTKSVIFTL
jgi:two-component sensor histidine kinase